MSDELEDIAGAIRDGLIASSGTELADSNGVRSVTGQGLTDALFEIANGLNAIAYQLKYLGNGNASTHMGAIEAHGKFVSEALERIASAIEER
jgi:hypothetical protein